MIKIKLKGSLSKDLDSAVKKVRDEKVQSLISALEAATPVDTGFAKSQWRLEGNSIVNDADYINQLNAGSSKQAPEYFVEKTLLAQTGVVPSGTIVRSK